MSPYVSKIDRRTALKWLSAAAVTLAVAPTMARAATYVKTPKGYGTDPDMLNPTSPWDRIMTDRQLQLTAVLTDIILPAEGPHPAPSAIGVPDFVNEWVSSPYEQTKSDQKVILEGLDWIDAEAKSRGAKGFVEADASLQLAIVTAIAKPDASAAHAFFKRFRHLTLGGYYSTPEGFADIGYIGNVPLESYPGPDAKMKAMLEERMKAIGI
ncbi:gluconate 2-dehydrogenase subunit 3 family protein [Pseudokordiimonas caeni]|uniref:gluconate 2-dehydrogenase subunit 3 family protein n=1 Tax=Pseudokordiimonas caeni TaxID=2997908 RepID=UPI0028119860|nr:gluconate 2-dehydrogenase subunit 3 family protein [Pseudokordiimonas caeni]